MIYAGSCECGAVSFQAEAERRDVTICHCGQCRRTAGHAWPSASVPTASVTISGEEFVKWYESSNFAQRGFCTECGASLFFRRADKGRTAIAAGMLQQPTGLKTGKHIFLADKGDYYEIACDAPVFEHYE